MVSHIMVEDGLHPLMVTLVEVLDFLHLRESQRQIDTQVLPATFNPPHHLHEILSCEGGVSWVGRQEEEKYHGTTVVPVRNCSPKLKMTTNIYIHIGHTIRVYVQTTCSSFVTLYNSYVHLSFLATLRSIKIAICGNFWTALLLMKMQNIARNGEKVT